VIVVRGVLNVPAYRALNRRTVERIRKKIAKKRERNPFSRLLNAKNDKDTIAAWKVDFNRFLHVFNVRPVIAVRTLLTAHSQTELAITTHVIVSDVHHSVVDTCVMVSEIHRSVVKSQEGADGRHPSVSDLCTLSHHRMNKLLPPSRHQPGQQPLLSIDLMSYICI